MEYPITLARDTNGTVLVSFVDFPEAHTFGDDILDALRRAPEALATVIDAYTRLGHTIEQIAAAHGGSLSVDSRPGEGASFALAWPSHALETQRHATAPVI